jgi:hypothetical protein
VPDLKFWYTVAVFILSIQLFVFILVIGGLVFGVGFGAKKLNEKLHQWVPLGQQYVLKGERLTKEYSAKVVEPPIRIASQAEGVRRTVRVLFGREG